MTCFDRKTKGFDLQEKLVYQIIEEAQNKGKFQNYQ